MLVRRLARVAPIGALAAAAVLVVPGCGAEAEGEPRREGLAIPLNGITYNVFITRQLNLQDPEDKGYTELPPAPPGSTYYGVFIQACNEGDTTLTPASDFAIVDTQGEEFEPLELEEGNPFAYEPTPIESDECTPEAGSVAAQGPTGGSLLVFEIPLEATENRPLELDVFQGIDPETAGPKHVTFELDI